MRWFLRSTGCVGWRIGCKVVARLTPGVVVMMVLSAPACPALLLLTEGRLASLEGPQRPLDEPVDSDVLSCISTAEYTGPTTSDGDGISGIGPINGFSTVDCEFFCSSALLTCT